jgi:hypothetical protein
MIKIIVTNLNLFVFGPDAGGRYIPSPLSGIHRDKDHPVLIQRKPSSPSAIPVRGFPDR